MNKHDQVKPLPANADNSPPKFDGEKIADAYRERRVNETAAAPMETDGEAGGAPNRTGTNPDAGARSQPAGHRNASTAPQPRADLPPMRDGAERDRLLPREGRSTYLLWIAIGVAVAVVIALFIAN